MPLTEAVQPGAFLGIPGADCIDDFTRYLFSAGVRDAVLGEFHKVVRPLLRRGAEVAIISHSWGTVVAYEGLRQLDGQPDMPAQSVSTFFTVGSALSIAPVKRRLLPEALDGLRPRVVRRWANLDARFDIVGGPLAGDPFEVDLEFLGLAPVGCSRIIPNPACAHSSYFHPDNEAVNKHIFARYIESP
jgi:hypothetical protein